jgi:hypothetical protein
MISTETRGLDKIRRKVARMPPALRGSVGRASREMAFELGREVKMGAAAIARTHKLERSVKVESIAGSNNTSWRVVSGGGDAFYGHMVDGGTRAGMRKVRQRLRKGRFAKSPYFHHPGSRATGYHRGRYRLKRKDFRARMRRAYREGAKAT